MSRLVLRPTLTHTQLAQGFFPRSKSAKCVDDYSPPCSSEVKNEWSYTSNPPICLHGVDTETFKLTVSSDLFDMTASLFEYTKLECCDL